LKALVFGHKNISIMAPIPTLLARAGLQVDVITHSEEMRACKNVDNLYIVDNVYEVVNSALEMSSRSYDLIIPCDDEIIGYILGSKASKKQKLRMLPVMKIENFEHLYSKIGLSRTLNRHGLETPDFVAVANAYELDAAVRAFSGEMVLKIDASCAGFGVFPCQGVADIEKYRDQLTYPLLVQEWIEGDLIDLSGFFQNGKLIFFQYSEMLEARPSPFGPSVLRQYQKLSSVSRGIYDKLNALGRALGAHGFANIGAIRSARDGKLYFIEADLRPTVWVEFPKFFGEDPALKLRRHFTDGYYLESEAMNPDVDWADKEAKIIVPYADRLDPEEILQNKYNCNEFRVNYFN
jgi:predicted ATP-grasp superfamily ATP-dependent carboligase